jgi:hypothetical protein
MNFKEKMQTGRTTRMLLAAQAAAIANPMLTYYVIFPNQMHADEIKKHRMPTAPENLRFVGASWTEIEQIHFGSDTRPAFVTLRREGTRDAFIDPDVVQCELEKLMPAFERYNAKPGEYGYKEPSNG